MVFDANRHDDLERYSRQLLVPGIDLAGQERLAKSRVLIVGCGGLGCPLAMYLAAAGVGTLLLLDDDRVESSNLPRQIAFTPADLGRPKAVVLAERLRQMNPAVQVEARVERLMAATDPWLGSVDLVLDASDSRDTRLLIEAGTRAAAVPWIMAAAVQLSGQWVAFSADREQGCYRCLAPSPQGTEGGCEQLGVLGPVVGSVALMQGVQALLYLAGADILWGHLVIQDFRRAEQSVLALAKRSDCPWCSSPLS